MLFDPKENKFYVELSNIKKKKKKKKNLNKIFRS